jgi:hypothetical protein
VPRTVSLRRCRLTPGRPEGTDGCREIVPPAPAFSVRGGFHWLLISRGGSLGVLLRRPLLRRRRWNPRVRRDGDRAELGQVLARSTSSASSLWPASRFPAVPAPPCVQGVLNVDMRRQHSRDWALLTGAHSMVSGFLTITFPERARWQVGDNSAVYRISSCRYLIPINNYTYTFGTRVPLASSMLALSIRGGR